MKRPLFIVVILTVLSLVVFYTIRQTKTIQAPSPQPEIGNLTPDPSVKSPFTASFEIYTLGTKRDFSDKKYHNASIDAYIEDAFPNNVIVNKDGITWQEFFATLPVPFKITSECLYTGTGQTFCNSETATLYFFLNDSEEPKALRKPISANDSLIIRYE